MNLTVLLSEESNNSFLQKTEDIIGLIGNLETLKGVLAWVFLVVVFFAGIIRFRKAVNQNSLHQINTFKESGKYIPELFTELNDNVESLRYFVFSKKWKRRIICEYNRQFRNTQGEEILEVLSEDTLSERLPYMYSIDQVIEKIAARKAFIKTFKEDSNSSYEKYGEKFFFIREYIYYIPEKLSRLIEKCEMIRQNSLLIVGSAGNGKTNLLCNLVETIILNKLPCCFINSRDIDGDCLDFVLHKLMPKQCVPMYKIFLRLVNLILSLSRKKLFVVIDAINENDSSLFALSIGKVYDELSKYSRFKIVCSCRSEYFDARYKRYFEKCKKMPYVFQLDQVDYGESAKEKMMLLYRRYYNVRVPLSINVRDRLMHSLLLMRLFFEVNKGRSGENLELCDAEIYKAYFDKVAQEIKPFDFRSKVDKIAKTMVEQNNYKKISINDLNLSTEDQVRLKKVLDDNLIISRTVADGVGITEREVEYVYFVFDELRDFCIARYLLTKDEERQNKSYDEFFDFASKLYTDKKSPLEGVLKYAYYYFRQSKKTELCKKILGNFSEYDPSLDEWGRWDHNKQNVFSNFGVTLVFQSAAELMDFELEYIVKSAEDTPKVFWEVFGFLLRNEVAGTIPDTRQIVDIMLNKMPYASTEKIVHDFCSDRGNLYDYRNQPRAIDYLVSAVEKYIKRRSELSSHLKIFLVILAGMEPHESALTPYIKFVDDIIELPEVVRGSEDILATIRSVKKRYDQIVSISANDLLSSLIEGVFIYEE